MAWEFIVLTIVTIVGPTLFFQFVPKRMELTVRGGGVFVFEYNLLRQVLRAAIKFGAVWAFALLLARLENRLWLRLVVVGLPLIGAAVHFAYVKKFNIHWLTGRPLAEPSEA